MSTDLFIAAMDKWGYDLQMTVCMEECAELIQEISKHLRDKYRDDDNLLSELADVSICIDSIISMKNLSSDDFKEIRRSKIERLAHRVIEG